MELSHLGALSRLSRMLVDLRTQLISSASYVIALDRALDVPKGNRCIGLQLDAGWIARLGQSLGYRAGLNHLSDPSDQISRLSCNSTAPKQSGLA